ncbi:MAG: acyl-CoA thioesterase [Saprospiraceae bacterium]|nr:acyl-CoA thioesterase [Saprospiraceae bacterium]
MEEAKITESSSRATLTPFTVRFHEVDLLNVMWHGHYLKLFEDGREDFGRRLGLSYLDVFREGYLTPVVDIQCSYKKSLGYGDQGIIETTFIPKVAAKLVFQYRIYLAETGETIATGTSTQVFLHKESRELQLTEPDFFADWKSRLNGRL